MVFWHFLNFIISQKLCKITKYDYEGIINHISSHPNELQVLYE